jgi:hypothetical protein
MRKITNGVFLMFLLCVAEPMGFAAEPVIDRPFQICLEKTVDPALAAVVSKRITETFGVEVSVCGEVEKLVESYPTLILIAAKEKEDVACLVWKNSHLCELNVNALGRPDSAGEEVYRHRLLKEVIRAVGGLLAMPTCPIWTCALSEHKALKELDEKGRGLCPPCMMRAAKHVHMLELRRAKQEKIPAQPPEKPIPGPSPEGIGS